jgi:hypothetical protein
MLSGHGLAAQTSTPAARSKPSGAIQRVRFSMVALWLVSLVAVAVAGWALRGSGRDLEQEQWDFVAPDSAPITIQQGIAYSVPAISPDGRLLVYTAVRDSNTMLYITRLGSGETHSLPQTGGGYAPFFAPDGRRLGFLSKNQIRTVDVTTGKVSVVREGIDALLGTWTDTDRIAFLDAAGYAWMDADGGGEIHRIPPPPRVIDTRPWPGITALPGSDNVLVSDFDLRIGVVSLSDGSLQYLTTDAPTRVPPPVDRAVLGVWARFVAPHYLVFWRPGAKLLAVRFDPRTLRTSGKPVEIQRGVRVNVVGLSPIGTWAYPPSLASGGRTLVDVGEKGISRTYPLPPRRYQALSLSPDGNQVAVRIMAESGRDITEVYDLSRGAVLTASLNAATAWMPQWGESGRYVYAASTSGIVYRRDTQANTQDSAVVALRRNEVFELDGVIGSDTIVATIGQLPQRDIYYIPYREPGRRIPLVQGEGDQFQAAVSATGRWLAYSALDGGGQALYVESRPTRGQRLRLGTGTSYLWDQVDQLFFVAAGSVYRTRVTAGADGPVAAPAVRVASAARFGTDGQPFAPAPGRRSLIALIEPALEPTTRLVVVRHWDRELAQRLR